MKIKEIKSLQNPLIKKLSLLRTDDRAREKEKEVFVTGEKMVYEISKRLPPKMLFSTSLEDLQNSPCLSFLVTLQILKKITGLPAPEKLAAIFPLPSWPLAFEKSLVLFDGIKDPGNVGTLIRSALAFNLGGAILIDCVDPFNDKALRAAKGATFFLPLKKLSEEEFMATFRKNNLTLYAADAKGKNINTVKTKKPFILALGSESHGLSFAIKEHAETVSIPISEEVESLNVASAGAILLFKFCFANL